MIDPITAIAINSSSRILALLTEATPQYMQQHSIDHSNKLEACTGFFEAQLEALKVAYPEPTLSNPLKVLVLSSLNVFDSLFGAFMVRFNFSVHFI